MMPGIRLGLVHSLSLLPCCCHSLSSSDLGQADYYHLQQAVIVYTSKISLLHSITAESALASPTCQGGELSSRIDENLFKSLFGAQQPTKLDSILF